MNVDLLQDIRDKLSSSTPIEFEPSKSPSERRVPAAMIAQALRDGVSVTVSNAYLDGPFDLQYALVRGEFRLTSCQVAEIADFRSATFERAVHLESCEFSSGVDMDSTRFRSDAQFDKCIFESPPTSAPGGGANIFNDAEFSGVLSFDGAQFKGPRMTSFQRVTFGSLVTCAAAHFNSELNFASARVRGNLVLDGSRFLKPCMLGNVVVDGSVRAEDAYFGRRSTLIFAEAVVAGKVALNGARVLGGLYAVRGKFGSVNANRTVFARTVRFDDSIVNGTADFSEARFLSHKRHGKSFFADFQRTTIDGQLKINDSAFHGILRLDDAKIGRDLVATNAVFKSWVTVNRLTASAVDLNSARFTSRDVGDTPSFSQLKIAGNFAASRARFQTGVSLAHCTVGALTLGNVRSFGTLSLAMTSVLNTLSCGSLHVRARDVAINLEGLRIGQIAWFDKSAFAGAVNAIGMQTMHQLSWNQVVAIGPVDFYELDARRGAFFRGATFGDSCTFMSANIAGEAYFSAAQFRGILGIHKTRATAIHFSKGTAPFDKAATLDRGISVQQCHFDYVSFFGVKFCDPESRKPSRRAEPASDIPSINFDHCEVSGIANFTEATFCGATRLYGNTFLGETLFQRTHFKAEDAVRFENDSFKARAVFFRVRFDGGATFSNCRFDNLAIFRARFRKDSTFENSIFAGTVEFSDPETHVWADQEEVWTDRSAALHGSVFSNVSFFQTRFSGDARFESALFGGELNLREAAFATLYLPARADSAEECKLLPRQIEMAGCRYEHVEIRHPRNLLFVDKNKLRLSRGYDRQSFAQLENTLRRSGNDSEADRVYLAGRRAERRQKSTVGKVADWLYGSLVNYGVRPWRLAVIAMGFVAFGTWFFSHRGTVELKEKELRGLAQYEVTWQEAVNFGIAHFLPVSLPIKDYLVPTSEVEAIALWQAPDGDLIVLRVRPTSIAMVLQLAGWILVPVGVAAMSGVLVRKSK